MRLYLYVLAFAAGLVTLGTELAASRLLAPFFGTSLVIWTSVIGLFLAALSAGYWLGGKLADRSPSLFTVLRLVAVAAVLIGIAPDLARPVFSLAISGMTSAKLGLLTGSFISVMALLGVPMILLGSVSPFAIRLATRRIEEAGRVSGQLYAISTLGSFLGAFLPVVFLIPSIGTRWTFISFALLLLAVTLAGFLLCRKTTWAATAAALLVGLAALGWLRGGMPVKPGARVVFEGESVYQYVRVVENDRGWRKLQLNEGVVVHSWYRPGELFTNGEWDYFALAPLFTPAPFLKDSARRWALIGTGAGTTARLISRIYGNVRIDGIELDPMVADVGLKFFGRQPSNYQVTVQDGRAWLLLNRETYDVIGIDAYRQPYIPFELTTVECFRQIRNRLSTNGVVAMNVVHLPGDDRLVGALVATLRQVFASVHVMHLGSNNRTSLVVASCLPVTLDDFSRNVSACGDSRLITLGAKAKTMIVSNVGPGPVLTDDCAPVEKLMDLMLLKYVMSDESSVKNQRAPMLKPRGT